MIAPSLQPTSATRRILQIVEEAYDVVCHQVVAEGLCVARGAAVAAAVHHDDAILSHKRADLFAPVARIGEAAMQKKHGVAPAELRIPDHYPIYGRVAAHRGLRQLGRRGKHHPGLFRVRRRRAKRHHRHQEPDMPHRTVPQRRNFAPMSDIRP